MRKRWDAGLFCEEKPFSRDSEEEGDGDDGDDDGEGDDNEQQLRLL